MGDLPALSVISSSDSASGSPLAIALSILFESSSVLTSILEPQLAKILSSAPPTSYSNLIDTALTTIGSWDLSSQVEFIAGHPRIGETKNLSNLSAKEQGGAFVPTPPEVLSRLSHLNACYEKKYPGLRYITFVNGRSRQAIAEEMEESLGLEHSLSSTEPPVSDVNGVEPSADEWKSELQRAIGDIGSIAKSRLKGFGVE